jgi:uncharacterized protein
MKTLVLCDDFWHPARVPRAGLEPLCEAGFEFDWIEDAGEWSAVRMAGYPLVVLTKSNNVSSANPVPWVTDEVQSVFVDYVRAGGGLLAIHSGLAGYENTAALRALLGGVFVQHPPQCPVTVDPQPSHALTAGSAPFTVQDEHYHMALDDANAGVFMTATSQHGTQPAGWTRADGAGRVCVLTPGHNLDVWLQPSYQALIRNALRWCAGAR